MNLYLILAIAFGTISGATDAPVGRRASASIVTAGVRHGAPVSSPACAAEDSGAPLTCRITVADTFLSQGVADAPLTGGATPRAPAVNC